VQPRSIAIFLLFVVSIAVPTARAGIDENQLRSDLNTIASQPARIIGSEGYYRTVEYVQSKIKALPNVELKRHEFPVMVPVTQRAEISLPDGSSQPIYPFYPASVRVNSTPPEGISGKLVYCGTGDPDELKPGHLSGNIAVVEATARDRWQQVAGFGPRAILILGLEDTSHVDLRSHDLLVPVNIPRFYVPPGPLNDRLRKSQLQGEATLHVQVMWQRKMAVNLYAYIAPRVGQMEGWTLKAPPAALMFSVPMDSSSLVPDLSPGAGQAVQTAAGLALLRDFARQPVDRPVVVFFSSADSIQFLGTRTMLLAMAESPLHWQDDIADFDEKIQQAGQQLTRAKQLAGAPEKLDVVNDRGLIDRIVKIIETDTTLEQDQLFRLRTRAAEDRTPESDALERRLDGRQVLLNQLRFSFSRRPGDLTSTDLSAEAKEYLQRLVARLGGGEKHEGLIAQLQQRRAQLQERIDLYQWLAGRVGRNISPIERDNSERPIELLVALDLSDGGIRAGPMFYGQFQRTSNMNDIQRFKEWFVALDRAFTKKDPTSAWFGGIRDAIDFEPLNQLRSPQSYLAAPLPIGSEMAQMFGVPGLSMITLDDLRLRRDTPTDTLERLKIDRIIPQLNGVCELFRKAWNDPQFVNASDLKRNRNTVVGQVVSPSSGRPVPDLPREGFLATYFYVTGVARKLPQYKPIPWTLGIRRSEVRECDAEGNYAFEGLTRSETTNAKDYYNLAIQVFRIDPASGAITACTDLGKQAGDIKLYADLRQDLRPMRSLVFNCEEFTLTGLYDPRFLQSLGDVIMLDARRNAEPQRYNVLVNNQLMAGFMEPGSLAYLVIRYGRVGNRLLLLNMPDPENAESPQSTRSRRVSRGEGEGFTIPQLNSLGLISLATSRDFWRLNDLRLAQYRKAGVSSSLLDDLHAQSLLQIKQAEWAKDANRGADVILQANGAWANGARVYNAAQDMARDVIRAAIFLLLLCVPFSFCMERLLIGTPNVYKQITGICVIFTIMTLALWSFHPAFKISASPLIIILSFAIIFMSIVVITVIYGKFDTELKKIRSGRGTAATTSFARASVLMSAVLLGIANMRKRRFRTVLTSVTVVLITFAVLCFTSAARYLDTTTLPAGVETSHSGVMMRQRGFRAMPPALVQSVRPVVRDLVGDRTVVERWWNVKPSDPREMVNVVAFNGGKTRTVAMSAVLGLTPGESQISKAGEVIGPGFDRLEKGDRDVVYMSKTTAEQLKVKEGDRVTVGGVELVIAGIYDPSAFDSNVRMLSGEPLAPLKYTVGLLDAGGRKLDDTDINANAAEQFDLDADSAASELGGTYEHLSSSNFVIVHADVSQMLQNATLRSVAVKLENEAEVKKVSDELAKRYAAALFAGFDGGVRMVTASNLASVSGAGQVAIPLAIAGLIIFNTMMGSIAERRREIHVYTSLGLAPMHVGALFVAEAMTYGLLGTVFGYVIGQGVGTALLHLGWLGNVTLNYSGTSAMLTMGLILFIVLLSALVPARLASKIAAPSIERSWRVPQPKNDLITAQLPFTINKTAADGALAYLAEFFDAHQEGSIGKFSSGKVETFTFEDEQHRASRGLKTTIWLTPFDLGVRQDLKLLIHPGQFPDIYEVQVILHRLSGDDGSWYRMNRTFLTELRKQFLQWRTLTPQRMLEYVDESHKLFSAEVAGLQPAV
jgi:ABC-type lipoprotein release transport system permease subunit